jgi:hypothetical protein
MEAEFDGMLRSSRAILSPNEASEVREFVEAREYSLALESFCGTLLDENKHVTTALYSRIQNLAEQLDGVDPSLIDSVKAAVRAE